MLCPAHPFSRQVPDSYQLPDHLRAQDKMVTFQAKFGLMLLELSAQDMGRHTMLLPQCQPHKYIQAVSQGCDFALSLILVSSAG